MKTLFPHPTITLAESVLVEMHKAEALRDELAKTTTMRERVVVENKLHDINDFLANYMYYSLMYAIEDYTRD